MPGWLLDELVTAGNRRDPIVVALGLAIREIAERRAIERLERHGKLTVVDGGKRRDAA